MKRIIATKAKAKTVYYLVMSSFFGEFESKSSIGTL